ncbi:MAG: RNA polymerase sigma factor [Polyangiaceae bacterium]|nr:RNA polymerase sigma factor [Polyangiaceae bacterium]
MRESSVTSREQLAEAFQSNRRALAGYLTRLVVREDVAEELVQQTAVRALEQERLPETAAEMRAWFFRVATNLALDHLRKHSTWREGVLGETRGRAEADAGFVAESRLLAGSPEMKTIAKDHLAVCFACTLRNLRHEESAALLLKEVYDFTVEEVARVMGASFGQAKAWIQSARARLSAKYDASCALVAQQGVCFQCVELDRFFQADRGDPLAGSQRDVDARLAIVRERREAPLGRWHRQMMQLVEEVLDEGPVTSSTRD